MNIVNSKTSTEPLRKGDKTLAVAVSSPVNDQINIIESLKIFESWGLNYKNKVITGRHWGYFSGKDDVRHGELHPKESYSLIAFARGGWGGARLLERHQPWKKGWILGFSDISSLLLARLAAGFDGGIHGPLLNSLSQEPSWSKERLKSILFEKSAPDLFGEPWNGGIAKGPLIASNLTVATHLLGSRHMPNLKGAILVIEDVGELPYRVDRMLTQWRLNGLLQNLAGIGLGNFSIPEGEEEKEKANHQKFSIEEILQDRCMDLKIPVVANIPVGHCHGNAALPLGWEATLDGYQGSLSIKPS